MDYQYQYRPCLAHTMCIVTLCLPPQVQSTHPVLKKGFITRLHNSRLRTGLEIFVLKSVAFAALAEGEGCNHTGQNNNLQTIT